MQIILYLLVNVLKFLLSNRLKSMENLVIWEIFTNILMPLFKLQIIKIFEFYNLICKQTIIKM